MSTIALNAPSTPPPKRDGGHLLWGDLPEFRNDPLSLVTRLGHKHPFVQLRFGPVYNSLLTHPDYIQHVLQVNNRNYVKDQRFVRIVDLAGASLFTTDGEQWLRRRRLMQPAFHQKQIAHFSQIMVSETERRLAQWQTTIVARHQPIDIEAEMMSLTMKVIGQAMFSMDISQDVENLHEAFAITSHFVAERVNSILSLPMFVPTAKNRAFKWAVTVMHEAVRRILQARVGQDGEYNDLLDMLLVARDENGAHLSQSELINEMAGIVFAGHETTAMSLTWTFYLLSQHPEVEQALYDELKRVLNGRVPTVQDLPNLPYTYMVLQESMRLYPTAWIASREALADDQIGPYHIPAKAKVLLNFYGMHHHPHYWEKPTLFNPKRFTPENVAERPKFVYMPFGGGPRKCIGQHFALTEAQLILAMIMQRYHLHLEAGQNTATNVSFMIRTHHGLQMRLEPR